MTSVDAHSGIFPKQRGEFASAATCARIASEIHSGTGSRLAELAGRQLGVVSRSQLLELGLTESSIGRLLAAGRIHRVFRGAYAVGHPTIDDRARMLAAVLACGAGAVVSHRSAAALLDLLDRAPVVVDVIARRSAGRGVDGIRRHHVPPPSGLETGTCDGVPCTSPSRTIVDLAGILGERSLRRVVERAAVHRVLSTTAIERTLKATRRRGAPALRTIMADWSPTHSEASRGNRAEGGPRLRSVLEARLLASISARGLPRPVCNRRIETSGGELVEVDLLWPRRRLVVEVDGRGFHDNPLAFERDRHRDRALSVSGYRIVRVTYAQIESEADEIARTIDRLLSGEFG